MRCEQAMWRPIETEDGSLAHGWACACHGPVDGPPLEAWEPPPRCPHGYPTTAGVHCYRCLIAQLDAVTDYAREATRLLENLDGWDTTSPLLQQLAVRCAELGIELDHPQPPVVSG